VGQPDSEDIYTNSNVTTSSPACQGQSDVAKEEQPMSNINPGIIPDEARRLAAYGVDSDRIPVYRIHDNESFKARLVGMLAQTLLVKEDVPYEPDEFGNQVIGTHPVEMSLNRYRVYLERRSRLAAMAEVQQPAEMHPGQAWEINTARAFDLRFLLQVITEMVGDNWTKWAEKAVTNPLTMGELVRKQYDKALDSLAEELSDGAREMPEFSNFVELAQRAITGEGLVNFVIDNDAKDYDEQLKRLVSQCKRRGDKVEPIVITEGDADDEVIVRFLGRLFVVPKMYTIVKGEYTLWDNREVAKTINWLISNGQMHIAIELVLQMPIVEQSRNKYLDSLSRNWAAQMFIHAPALATGLRNGLGHKWLDTRVTLSGNKVIKGEYDPRTAKLVPIREISFTESKAYIRLYKNIAHLFPFNTKKVREEDGTVKEVPVEEQWTQLLAGIGPTNPNWLKKGKGMLGDILHDTKADPGKTGKRVRPFTGGAFWALIPTNYTAKLIGEPKHREKFIRMAAEVDIELTDDDFSKMLIEETPFDAKGGIYVSEWLASHIIIEQKDGTFHQMSDGDKFTRLVHGDGWAVLVKGLIHIMPNDQMDADIIIGEDCLKFFAKDELVQDSRYDLIVSDIAADYLNLDWLRASPMIMAYYPEFYVELVKRGIANAGLKELCQGVATVDDIVDVLSFIQFDGEKRIDPVGQMVEAGIPITYEGNWGHHDNNWWKYLRQRIQQILNPRFFGVGGKLTVGPDNLMVRSWLDERWMDDGDDGRLVGWQAPVPLPRTAISVPADVYHAILQHFGERDREWLKVNKGIVAAQCAYPFTGHHGLIKAYVYAHDSRHRCVYVGADLLDLVERDCDGDPEVAFLDRELIERCAVSYEYARKVRDEVAIRTEDIIKAGKDKAKAVAAGDSDDLNHLWEMMPKYPHLAACPTASARRDSTAARAAECILLASIDHMGGADNALRRVKMLGTDLALWDEEDKEGEAQFRRDVELGVLFQILSQTAVAEKEGQTIVVIPKAMKMEAIPQPNGKVKTTFPNIEDYLRLFGISPTDVPDPEEICGTAPENFRAVSNKKDDWGDTAPSYRKHPWKKDELTHKNTVDAFRVLSADCHTQMQAGATDPYTMVLAEFHGHVELGEPLCLADMETAVSNAVSSLYQKDITISKKSWMSKTQPVYNIPGRKQLTRVQLWYKTWAAWCDCPICSEAIFPDHKCGAYGDTLTRKDWDECTRRAHLLFDKHIAGDTTGDERDALKRRFVITCLLSDYNSKNGRMLGYGNVPMIIREMDKELWDRTMIELHNIAGSDIPANLFDGIRPTVVDEEETSSFFSIHVDTDCDDGITRWYLRYPDGYFHHVGRTDNKYKAAHRAFIRAEKERVTVGEITFTDESVAKYFHAQLGVIENLEATGDVLRISSVYKLADPLTGEPVRMEAPIEVADNDPPPTGGSSPAIDDEANTNGRIVLGCFANADAYTGKLISIAKSAPHDFAHEYTWMRQLAPDGALLATWKREKDIDNYIERYKEHIRPEIEPIKTWVRNLTGACILLCWEPDVKDVDPITSNFCHRILVGKMIRAWRPDLKVVVDGLTCPACGESLGNIDDVVKGKVNGRTAHVCTACSKYTSRNAQVTDKAAMKEVIIYTEPTAPWRPGGGSRKGISGVGVVLVSGEHRKELSASLGEGATNQAALPATVVNQAITRGSIVWTLLTLPSKGYIAKSVVLSATTPCSLLTASLIVILASAMAYIPAYNA